MCSGLCKIKDTGDSMFASSGRASEYGLFFLLTGHKNRINKPGTKASTQCSWLSADAASELKALLSFAALQQWTASRPEQPVWSAFIYPCQPGYAVYCLFSIYIEFHLKPDSERKSPPLPKKRDNLIQKIRAVARAHTKGWHGQD